MPMNSQLNSYSVNEKHKDRLFCLIFGSEKYKENALELYNAMNGSNFTDPDDISIETLNDAIYLKRKNDAAYLVNGHLALVEEQSSINPNMPLRGFNYFSELYSRYVRNNSFNIYSSKLLKIPTPQYIVFYVGDKNAPPCEKLRLSNMFTCDDFTKGDFEWTATVYNLLDDENAPLLKRSKTLADYVYFVEKVREFSYTMSKLDAINKAVDMCIEEGRLLKILSEGKAEVRDLLIYEFDEVAYERDLREEGREEGRAEGEANMVKRLFSKGKTATEISELLDIPSTEIEEMLGKTE